MRRGTGRARTLIGTGAVLGLVGMVLPWFTVGGEVLPAISSNGFGGAGILVFLASVGLLAVLVLPYASSTGRSTFDTPVVYIALVCVGFAGIAIEVVGNLDAGRLGLPDRAAGLWLAAAGMILAAWGVGSLVGERRRGA